MLSIRRTPRQTAFAPLLAALLIASSCGGDAPTAVGGLTVSLTPSEALLVGTSEVVRFAAEARDSSGKVASGQAVSWSVADPGVASVDASGLVMAVGEGSTTLTVSIGGASTSAPIEVYVPEDVSVYVPGQSYRGRNGYVEYIPGELPVVLSAPHGGDLTPSEIPDRTLGVSATDRNTVELVLAVRDALVDLTGHAPHLIISHLDRSKLDPNREIGEAAQGSMHAELAWREFQTWIEMARTTVHLDFGRGMYFDMHGHGHDIDRLELGYLLSANDLSQDDASLNALAVVAQTSIRDLGRDSPIPFSQLLRGPTSFGGYLQAEGVRSVPSPSDPSPAGQPYFTGGYNTVQHGSRTDGEVVSGIQIEHHFPGLRDTDENRRIYADRLARALAAFMGQHFGFFAPTG